MYTYPKNTLWLTSGNHIYIDNFDTRCILTEDGRVYDVEAGRYYSGTLVIEAL